MAIPQGFLQELLTRVDVVEVVGRHVQLKKSGANYSGLCPFHSEKSPSFTVSPTKQFYHCFGCGKNGNAIGFLMDHSGLNFVEAVQELAGSVGLSVPQDDRSPQDRERARAEREKQASLTDLLEQAARAYRGHLRGSAEAVAYLKGRGVSGEVARQFGLGYAPAGWRSLASVFPDYADPRLVESGLVIAAEETPAEGAPAAEGKRYDRFRHRIMFPIRNVKGDCIGFGGRVLGDEKPKYLNSPETPVFSKGRELYGLFEARQAIRDNGHVLVTEGYMDVVALAQLGFANAVATLGTACTADHVRQLFRFTDQVVFSFDGDAAGRRAARKALDAALPWASDTRSVKFLFLPPEHDPDSYVREHGAEGFARFVAEAVPLSRFLIDAARDGCDLSSAEGRALLASQARPLWQALPDGALKRQLLGELADHIALPPRELQELWNTPAAGAGSRGAAAAGRAATRDATADPGRRRAPDRDGQTPVAARRSVRMPPSSRADHACRLLLTAPALWDSLSAEDHEVLSELQGPHAPLLVWLEAQFHEHGAQPWAALREALRGQPFESLALQLVTSLPPVDAADTGEGSGTPSPDDSQQELRSVLTGMLIERLKRLENEAIAQASRDATAVQRYRELQARRRALET